MRSTYKNLFCILIVLTIFSLLAETTARVLGLDASSSKDKYLTPQERFFFTVPINKRDPYLFWRLKPLASFGKISISSKGFRGKEFSEEKNPGVSRIITLGDSCTLGVGIEDDETYSAALQRILNERKQPSGRYEVINAGVAGYSSLQGLRFFKTDVVKYKPDIITVQFGFNDYLYTGGPSDKDVPESSNAAIFLDDIMGESHLYRFIKNRLDLLTSKKPTYPPNRRVDLPDFKKNIKELISAARESGIKVILLNLPVRPDVPLVVNPVPKPGGSDGKGVEWLRPAIIEGKNYFVESDFDGPASVLEKAVEKYPRWALAHYFLAKKYDASGENEKAQAEFRKAKETDVDRKVIAEYSAAVKEVAGEMNAPMIDLVGVFEAMRDKSLFLDERHTNAAAHAIIAEEIFKTLTAN
ncbi:MAG: hypothetical protein HZA14_00685 [Nitrospirae bacterium]|nr:hypothetical protein [Nitrospirota bacterium]